jgi:hypothetical protein
MSASVVQDDDVSIDELREAVEHMAWRWAAADLAQKLDAACANDLKGAVWWRPLACILVRTMENQKAPAISLVRAAFAAARASGKPDWQRMTVAVLKNRMLLQSQRQFRESDYGANNFTGFVESLPDLLRLDSTAHTPTVQLVDAEVETLGGLRPANAATVSGRVRADLWAAALNFSGRRYVWDVDLGRARAAGPGDDGRPTARSVESETMLGWRREFAALLDQDRSEAHRRTIDRWVASGAPALLPSSAQSSWYAFLKARVADHLRSWFAEAQIGPPHDLVVDIHRRAAEGASDAEDLRQVMIDCVRVMSMAELSEIRVSLQVVARLRRRSDG